MAPLRWTAAWAPGLSRIQDQFRSVLWVDADDAGLAHAVHMMDKVTEGQADNDK